MYRYKLNASNISQENDGFGYWTYAKGFGDYADGEEFNAKLIREYTSPLAKVIGKREAPPIYDGRITQTATMDEQLKELVDTSLQISVSADITDLRKQGYALAQPELGDRFFLIDERIGLNDEVRANYISVTRDWQGNVLDLKLTLGSKAIQKRYQSNLQTAIDRITDLLEGRQALPYDVLTKAIKANSEALKSALTELEFNSGIIARDPNNPNRLVIYNSAGLGISLDGGRNQAQSLRRTPRI
jgi:hypothetical protein